MDEHFSSYCITMEFFVHVYHADCTKNCTQSIDLEFPLQKKGKAKREENLT